jgi:hypothetical protein
MNIHQVEELILQELGVEKDPKRTWNKLVEQFEGLRMSDDQHSLSCIWKEC